MAEVHEIARAMGLVYLRHGKLLPTAAAKRLGDDPARWVKLLVEKLPCGQSDFERHAGCAALLAVGSDTGFDLWHELIPNTLVDMGWRKVVGDLELAPEPHSLTLSFLEILVRGLSHRSGNRAE